MIYFGENATDKKKLTQQKHNLVKGYRFTI